MWYDISNELFFSDILKYYNKYIIIIRHALCGLEQGYSPLIIITMICTYRTYHGPTAKFFFARINFGVYSGDYYTFGNHCSGINHNGHNIILSLLFSATGKTRAPRPYMDDNSERVPERRRNIVIVYIGTHNYQLFVVMTCCDRLHKSMILTVRFFFHNITIPMKLS